MLCVFHLSCVLHVPSISCILIRSPWKCMVKRTNFETPPYAFHFPSSFCYRTPRSKYYSQHHVFKHPHSKPLSWETNIHTNVKQLSETDSQNFYMTMYWPYPVTVYNMWLRICNCYTTRFPFSIHVSVWWFGTICDSTRRLFPHVHYLSKVNSVSLLELASNNFFLREREREGERLPFRNKWIAHWDAQQKVPSSEKVSNHRDDGQKQCLSECSLFGQLNAHNSCLHCV